MYFETIVFGFACLSYASSLPQYNEELYHRQLENSEQSSSVDTPGEPQKVPLIQGRAGKPLIKVYKVASQQQYTPSEDIKSPYSTPIPIIRFDKTQSLDGSYKSSYETGNNIVAEETGFIKNIGIKDQEALVQHGSYTYTAPDGSIITTSYTADEGGFRVEGSHLPTPPPIPEEIQKSLATIYESIRLQQEAEAKEAKYGKTRTGSTYDETNSVFDNYPNNLGS